MLVDIGTSSLTGICRTAAAAVGGAATRAAMGQAVLPTLALDAATCHRLGSDFARAGFVFEAPVADDGEFTDAYGVGWLYADGSAAPYRHPLEHAALADIARHPRPIWPEVVQQPDARAALVIADAPCPGLLETCFALRGAWQFMDDVTCDWRASSALLDWSLETVALAYERMLTQLSAHPDLMIYGDDYGFGWGMFLSDVDFRTFVKPRLRTLFSRLRRLCPAPICFHSCGAIRPIVGDLVDLGVELLNLDPLARQMVMPELRTALPGDVVLHAPVDLVALGTALATGDLHSIAILTVELAACAPAIAAPLDSVPRSEDVRALTRAAAYVHTFDADDWSALRRFGAVRTIVDKGIAAAAAAPVPRKQEEKTTCH